MIQAKENKHQPKKKKKLINKKIKIKIKNIKMKTHLRHLGDSMVKHLNGCEMLEI